MKYSLSVTLEPAPPAARQARDLLRDALLRWDREGLYDDAALVLTELVSNALRSALPVTVTLSAPAEEKAVTLEVTDRAAARPVARCAADDDEGGRGLLVIAALSSSWGVRPAPGGKTVYAVIDHG